MRGTTKKPARKSTRSKARKPSPSDTPPRDIIITGSAILIRSLNETPLLVAEGDIVTFHAPNSNTPAGKMSLEIDPPSPPLFGEQNHKLVSNTEYRVAAGTKDTLYSWVLKTTGQEPMQGKIVVNSGQGD